ncbi:M48 family metalloprotease [Altererythrobacter soli]|uniref:M48 family metalloprotease n=1 Tax=Croceibacterium soli TaxID=1739690 RepID=A0A6I4UUP6_9SPHN|nr:M48 family metallopeptidase [Croceibacterium soli]MXP42358.1 M48 family metalloprotease [Croceibacterium soli]
MNRPLLAAAGALLISTGAAAKEQPLPPFTLGYEPQTVDERGMWSEADEWEKSVKSSTLRVDDEGLNAYVREVLCKTVGTDRCDGVRVYVLNIPAFNATMSPNGMMMVWTGLLLRARSEAELGAVLGHEFAHFELRHSLKGFQARRSASDVLAWTQVLGNALQVDTRNSQFSLIGSLFRFNREQEKEADLLGLDYLAQSKYPSRSASEVWQHLMEEADATATGRKIKKRHRYRAGFFDTHPTELDRADYLLEQSMAKGDTGDAGAASYYAALSPWLPKLLEDQVRLNDFAGTEYLLNSIAATTGWTGELLQARAELFATRGNPRDLITATTLYLNAIDVGHSRPATMRGLGLSLVKSGKRSEGAEYLRKYLEAEPGAPDASLIRMYVPDERTAK